MVNDLSKLSQSEWEDLCHRCGYCCTVGDDTSGRVACRLLDLENQRCTDYPNRQKEVPNCARITPDNVWTHPGLPDFCGYKQYARGEPIGGPKVNAIPITIANGDLAKRMLGQ